MGVVEPLKVSWHSGHNIIGIVEPQSLCLNLLWIFNKILIKGLVESHTGRPEWVLIFLTHLSFRVTGRLGYAGPGPPVRRRRSLV
jgi:hypothetical protein